MPYIILGFQTKVALSVRIKGCLLPLENTENAGILQWLSESYCQIASTRQLFQTDQQAVSAFVDGEFDFHSVFSLWHKSA